jgi:hypothetical protein
MSGMNITVPKDEGLISININPADGKGSQNSLIRPLEGKSASTDPKGKVSASSDPKGVGLGPADPRNTLSASPDRKGTAPAPSDPTKGVSASPDGIYANKPSDKGRVRAKGAMPLLTTLDVTRTPRHDAEQ